MARRRRVCEGCWSATATVDRLCLTCYRRTMYGTIVSSVHLAIDRGAWWDGLEALANLMTVHAIERQPVIVDNNKKPR